MGERRFNIRAYGLLFKDQKVLLCDETMGDFAFTKFPGGGLEWGEGIEDCLMREFKEECSIDVTIDSHLYTTGFFQQSAFHPNDQLVSIYYRVQGETDFDIQPILTNTDKAVEHKIHFRWKLWSDVIPADFTFPVDQYLINLLKKQEYTP